MLKLIGTATLIVIGMFVLFAMSIGSEVRNAVALAEVEEKANIDIEKPEQPEKPVAKPKTLVDYLKFETKFKTKNSSTGLYTDISYITTATFKKSMSCTFELEWTDKDGFPISSTYAAIWKTYPVGSIRLTGTDMVRGTGIVTSVMTKVNCR